MSEHEQLPAVDAEVVAGEVVSDLSGSLLETWRGDDGTIWVKVKITEAWVCSVDSEKLRELWFHLESLLRHLR